jgi:hypothetical protein
LSPRKRQPRSAEEWIDQWVAELPPEIPTSSKAFARRLVTLLVRTADAEDAMRDALVALGKFGRKTRDEFPDMLSIKAGLIRALATFSYLEGMNKALGIMLDGKAPKETLGS